MIARKLSSIEGSDSQTKVFGGVVYECVRCGSKVTADELSQLLRSNAFAVIGF